jgi:hypothetical protein
MRARLLFATLIAFAMALAPLAMPAGAAAMAAPAHHGTMAKAGHCPDAPRPSHHQGADKGCCVAGCMALALLPALAADPAGAGEPREWPGPDRFRLGYLGEIATPPPRPA